MELTGDDINVLKEFFGGDKLKRLMIRTSISKGEMIMKLKIDVVTVNDVRRSLRLYISSSKILIFEK